MESYIFANVLSWNTETESLSLILRYVLSILIHLVVTKIRFRINRDIK